MVQIVPNWSAHSTGETVRRRLIAIVSAVAFAAGGLVVGATQAQAAHSCSPDIPCYPHVCVDIKRKPYLYFCNG